MNHRYFRSRMQQHSYVSRSGGSVTFAETWSSADVRLDHDGACDLSNTLLRVKCKYPGDPNVDKDSPANYLLDIM